jgi:hypothetical protein
VLARALPVRLSIVAPDGRVLAGPLGNEEAILYADLDLNETIRAGQVLDIVGHYARSEVLGLHFNPAAQTLVTTGEPQSVEPRVRMISAYNE